MTDLRQIRYEAARPELVERMIDIVRHRQGHALAAKIERAKIELTAQAAATMDVDLTEERLTMPLTRAGFDAAIVDAVDRVAQTIAGTLADARLAPSQITTLFLTGGSTAVPLLKQTVLAMFPSATIVEGDMFGSVGLGLALDARRKYGT